MTTKKNKKLSKLYPYRKLLTLFADAMLLPCPTRI